MLPVILAITEIVKLINHYNETLSAEEAAKHTARFARVLDFLFGWLDKEQVKDQPAHGVVKA